MRAKISAFVVCQDEETHIRRCLESLKWCDELIVIDSGSKDQTLSISQEYTNKIVHRAWGGFVEQKRFGLTQCQHEWVLNLDADEELSPELHAEIEEMLVKGDQSVNGYELSRVVFYMNKWWRRGGWYPEYRLRLCRKSTATWGGDDPHEKAMVTGKVLQLQGELRHYTYSDISDQVRALNSHSSSAARTLFKKGESTTVIEIFSRPVTRFLKFYFLKGGYREGFPGLVVAVLEAYYVFLKYVKLWELRRGEK